MHWRQIDTASLVIQQSKNTEHQLKEYNTALLVIRGKPGKQWTRHSKAGLQRRIHLQNKEQKWHSIASHCWHCQKEGLDKRPWSMSCCDTILVDEKPNQKHRTKTTVWQWQKWQLTRVQDQTITMVMQRDEREKRWVQWDQNKEKNATVVWFSPLSATSTENGLFVQKMIFWMLVSVQFPCRKWWDLHVECDFPWLLDGSTGASVGQSVPWKSHNHGHITLLEFKHADAEFGKWECGRNVQNHHRTPEIECVLIGGHLWAPRALAISPCNWIGRLTKFHPPKSHKFSPLMTQSHTHFFVLVVGWVGLAFTHSTHCSAFVLQWSILG